MTATHIRQVALRVIAGNLVAGLLSFLAFRLNFNLSSATSIHLFLVVVVALRWGFLEAGIVSIFSVACLDFLFTQPLFALYISDSHDWVALLTFEAAALLVSRLSNQAERHARESELHQERLQTLYELSQQILLLDQKGEVEQELAALMRTSLRAGGVALWNSVDERVCVAGTCSIPEQDVRLGIESDDAAKRISRRVLRSGTRAIGALVLCEHTLDAASINAAASLAAVAIERARSFSTEANAEAARQSEQLRSAILDGLAHAFKSPLTTIMVSSSGLLTMDTLSGVEKKLVGMIDRQAGKLSHLTNHLLLTASLDREDLKLEREAVDLDQLIESSIADCSTDCSHPITKSTLHTNSVVYADRKLLQMAFVQILDNAMKYSASGSSLTIGVEREEGEVTVTIRNQGSFIPLEERTKVFQRFYRCPESSGAVSGTGIGLSIVKRIAEAHNGCVSVESDRDRGTTFFFTLPHSPGRHPTWNERARYSS